MATASPLVLLHLSDLHFTGPETKGHYWNSESTELDRPKHDRKGILGRLLDDLASLRAKPNLVVVSGDLLHKVDEGGIPLAQGFLKELAGSLGFEKHHERVVLVPGNHDVDWTHGRSYSSFDQIYKDFYGETHHGVIGQPGHLRADLFDYPELGVLVAGFNSCEALDVANQQGTIDGDQLAAMAEKLKTVTAPRLRIAVMHHHAEQPQGDRGRDVSVMADAVGVRAWLRNNGFSLVLHGHQHVDWQTTAEDDDWRLTVVAGGSLGVGTKGRIFKWRLPLCYQLLLIGSDREGLRLRREYSERYCRWDEAAHGGDTKNRALQKLRFGPLRGPSAPTRGDSRRFLPDFDRLLGSTEQSLCATVRRHRQKAETSRPIDIRALAKDLSDLLDRHPSNKRSRFSAEARRLLCRIVLDVPASTSPVAAPPIRLYSNAVESAPVSTYLFVAILVAQAQDVAEVGLHADKKYGVAGDDGLSAEVLAFAPTLDDAVHEFEKVLWERSPISQGEPYLPKCDCPLDECQQHRLLRDQLDKCNQRCCRYLLYADLKEKEEDGHRPYVVVDPENWTDWSSLASRVSEVSFIRFGGGDLAAATVDEDALVGALKKFFSKANGAAGNGATR